MKCFIHSVNEKITERAAAAAAAATADRIAKTPRTIVFGEKCTQ